MRAQIPTIAWLSLVWVALLSDFSLVNIISGLVISTGLVTLFRPSREPDREIRLRPLRMAIFILYFFAQFLRANLQVALAVLDPDRVRDRRAVIAVPIAAPNEIAVILLANAISLTPGTFIFEIQRDPPTLYVHILQLGTLREARLAILELEEYIARAVESPGGIERVRELKRIVAEDSEDRQGVR